MLTAADLKDKLILVKTKLFMHHLTSGQCDEIGRFIDFWVPF